jgi:hypothetical protein
VIFETNKRAFHARFRDHAARIMRTYGFQIAAMWEARSGEKPDEAAKIAAWSAFTADTEWAEIKRTTSAKHGALIGGIEDRILVPLDYSPAAGRSMLLPAA